MKKTAIIYARVSTVRQADEGLPIESQVEQARAKAAQLDTMVLREFLDEGISGRTSNRPAFQEAVAFCAAMKVDYFIAWNTSRFARNKIDAASFKALLRRGGTKVVYAASDIDTDTDEGWFSESIFEIVDEHYSRVIARDTKRSMMKNARDGNFNGGRVPYGYHVVDAGKRKRLAINEDEAQAVRDIYALYIQGAGAKEVAMAMNRAGRTKRGTTWNKNTVALLLKNPVNAGFVVFNRTSGRDPAPESKWIMTRSHDPIVSEEAFMNVQDIMRRRSPKEAGGSPHSRVVFTGILRCGSCGAAMQTETANGRSATYHYYNCRSSLKGAGCTSRRIPAKAFDDWMVGVLLNRVLTADRITDMVRQIYELRGEWYQERARRRDELVAALRATEKKRDNLFEVLELHGKNAPNLGDMTRRLRTHKSKIEELELALGRLEEGEIPEFTITDAEILEATTAMREIITTTEDVVRLRTFFQGFVERIVLGEKTVEIHYDPQKIINRSAYATPVHSEAIWLPDRPLLRTIVEELPGRFKRAA